MATSYYGYPGSRYDDLYRRYGNPDNPVDQIGPALDTTQPRPSYAAAAGGGAQPQTPVPGGPSSGAPGLEGLQHSSQLPARTPGTPDPGSAQHPKPGGAPAPAPAAPAPAAGYTPPAYLQPLINAIPGLTQPVGIDPSVVNQVTRMNQGASSLAANQLREKMGSTTGGLLRPGDSGLADTALGSIYRGGAADTAKTLGGMAAQLPQLNLQRLLAAGQLGSMLSGDEMTREQFGYNKEMDALKMLMDLYGAEQQYQNNAWSPYYSGIVNAYGR